MADGMPVLRINPSPTFILTDGQQAFIEEALKLFHDVLENEKEGDFAIDLDEIDDQVRNGGSPKPGFYHSEISQQNKFACRACKARHDILGRFGFCSCCGARNDLQMLQQEIAAIRKRINSSGSYSNFVKDAISAFDTMGRNYAQILRKKIPMTPARKARLEKLSFHNLETFAAFIQAAFDIDLFAKMNNEDIQFITRMFHRRHIYEHNGGEVDEKYLKDSGDTSVKLKQAIRETQSSAHKTCDSVLKIAQNFHDGYHSILPPISKAVESGR